MSQTQALFLCNIGIEVSWPQSYSTGRLPHREITFSSVTIFLLPCVIGRGGGGLYFKRVVANEGEIHWAA
jgi:hypothetical protein